jgi:hypothetical protein
VARHRQSVLGWLEKNHYTGSWLPPDVLKLAASAGITLEEVRKMAVARVKNQRPEVVADIRLVWDSEPPPRKLAASQWQQIADTLKEFADGS